MRRLVAGERPIEIASCLGMTTARLSIIMNSPIFKQELARLSTGADRGAIDVAGRIQETSIKAMEILESLLDGRAVDKGMTSFQQAKLAQDMLDRAGHGAVQKRQVAVMSTVLTPEDIEELKRRKRTAGGD